MNITLLTLGTLKDKSLQELAAEYTKRLSAFSKINIIEIKELSFSEKSSRDQIKKQEAELLLKKIKPGSTIIALHETGKQFDSVNFAQFLEKQTVHGEHIVFIIGGPLGLHDSILEKVHVQLSLSPMTFTHQMTRVILLEQLYRANTIVKGKTYHY